jgi:hypothetical protein
MNLSLIVATKRRLFSALLGDNKLATLNDVNSVVNGINNMFPYRMYDFLITQSGTTAPVVTKLAAGAGECNGNCDCKNVECDCVSPCGDERRPFIIDPTYVEAGTYDLTIDFDTEKYPKGIKHIGFFFGALPSVENQVAAVKISDNVYRITTGDKTAALANGKLTDTPVMVKVYFQG